MIHCHGDSHSDVASSQVVPVVSFEVDLSHVSDTLRTLFRVGWVTAEYASSIRHLPRDPEGRVLVCPTLGDSPSSVGCNGLHIFCDHRLVRLESMVFGDVVSQQIAPPPPPPVSDREEAETTPQEDEEDGGPSPSPPPPPGLGELKIKCTLHAAKRQLQFEVNQRRIVCSIPNGLLGSFPTGLFPTSLFIIIIFVTGLFIYLFFIFRVRHSVASY
jgi:hypothetical protein